MGKKRVTYDLNDAPKHVVRDHHHHHHHRHHNHQKSRKIKPEAKLLHTLNSHLKKLPKSRSRNILSHSRPHPTTVSRENNKRYRDHLSCWLIKDNKDRCHDWFMAFDSDHEDAHFNYDIGVFEFGQDLCWKKTSFIGSENIEDLFGGDCMFTPDLTATHNVMLVFEEDEYVCGSYIPDPIMNLDSGDEGKYLYDMLELSSQEDMINEFLKVNLFVS